MGTFTDQDPAVAPPRARMTSRAARWATRRASRARAISEIAAELGCNWHTQRGYSEGARPDGIANYRVELLLVDALGIAELGGINHFVTDEAPGAFTGLLLAHLAEHGGTTARQPASKGWAILDSNQ